MYISLIVWLIKSFITTFTGDNS